MANLAPESAAASEIVLILLHQQKKKKVLKSTGSSKKLLFLATRVKDGCNNMHMILYKRLVSKRWWAGEELCNWSLKANNSLPPTPVYALSKLEIIWPMAQSPPKNPTKK